MTVQRGRLKPREGKWLGQGYGAKNYISLVWIKLRSEGSPFHHGSGMKKKKAHNKKGVHEEVCNSISLVRPRPWSRTPYPWEMAGWRWESVALKFIMIQLHEKRTWPSFWVEILVKPLNYLVYLHSPLSFHSLRKFSLHFVCFS